VLTRIPPEGTIINRIVLAKDLNLRMSVQTCGRYKVTQPTETTSLDDQNRRIYHFSVGVIDAHAGKIVREFKASDLDDARAALRAVDEMLGWLKNAPE
jgi:hypothetical protein